MKASQSRKLRQASDAGLDFLSNLPELIKVEILALLPLKAAVRTSALSKRWRHTWLAIPSLVIYENEIGLQTLSEFIALVYRLLSSHIHSMAKLKLVFRHRYKRFDIKEDLDKWINTLLEKHVHELVLDLGYYATIEIPADLFSLPDLEVVNLRGCELNVPKYFDGFKLVYSLKLENVKLTGIEIETLVSSCPLLKYFLIRTKYLGLNDLAICSPSLLELEINADFKDLYLKTPKLVTLSVKLHAGYSDFIDLFDEYGFPSKYENNISRLMCCLPQVENLNICWNFVKYLDGGVVPAQLPVSLNLSKMTIELNNVLPEYFNVALCLLQSAPRLSDLHIKFDSEEHVYPPYWSFWEYAGAIDCQLTGLKTVIIGLDFLERKCIFSFIKFILKSAPVLEMIGFEKISSIKYMPGSKKLMMKLLELPRLSNKAIIKII